MRSSTDLQKYRIQTLWVLDESGDMLTSNEPNPADRQRAPKLHLEWSALERLHVFRDDVATDARAKAADVIEAHWPFAVADQAQIVDDLLHAVGGQGRSYSGPVFTATGSASARSDTVRITRANAELLQEHLSDWQEGIEFEQPVFARIVSGAAVSICATVRRSAVGVEAGVDTVAGHRRQGHGKDAVAAWGSAIKAEGLTAFYSTSWDNVASISLARSLGYNQVGASIWVD